MVFDEKAEEILETLWIRTQEEKQAAVPLADLGPNQQGIDQLLSASYISVSNDRVSLAGKAIPEAAVVVRRHRLAERLLNDVLAPGAAQMDDRACKFEHLLDRGLEESICVLLGHPRVCPHGKAIPPGRCCQNGRQQPHKLVSPLSQMMPGETGRIAYVFAPLAANLQKLMSMGILPGSPVNLVQRFPSYVFRVRQTEFAVDKDIADSIYVRLGESPQEQDRPEKKTPFLRRFGWGRGKDGSL